MKPVLVLPVIALLLILSCGCTESPPAQPSVSPTPATPAITPVPVKTLVTAPVVTVSQTASVSDNTIIIYKNTFRPANMTVKVGSTVRWYNTDDHPHRIEFENKGFSTSAPLLGASQTAASLPFKRPGLYNYSCMIHPEMQGSVLVEE